MERSPDLMTPQSNVAIGAVLTAASLWAVGNVAYRYGEGSALAMAAERAFIGVLVFAPLLLRSFEDGRLAALTKDRAAMVTVLASGATIPLGATMLRSLTGPQVALVAALTPAVIVVANRLLRGDPTRAMAPLTLACLAATGAALSGGVGTFAAVGIAAAALILIIDTAAILSAERARQRHSAGLLVAAGMVAGVVESALAFAIVQPAEGLAPSGAIAALLVGVTGTLARALRHHALPFLGSAVAFSSSYITAFLTAVGGIWLFGDELRAGAALLGLLAGAFAFVATVVAAKDASGGQRPRSI